MAEKKDKPGGYSIEFVKPIDARYKCRICSLTLRSPFQTECGHRFCETCIKDIIINGLKQCPIDQSTLGLNQIFQDKFCNREILEMVCYCDKKTLGCAWNGELRSLEQHLGTCLFTDVVCPNNGCGIKMQRQFMEKHLKETCQFKKLPCKYCGMEVPHRLMQTHFGECTKMKVPCPNKCGIDVVRENLQQHFEAECPKVETTCPYAPEGCQYQGTRADLEKHLLKSSVKHSFMIQAIMTNAKSEAQNLRAQVAELSEQRGQLEQKVATQNDEIALLKDEVASLRPRLDECGRKLESVQQNASAAIAMASAASTAPRTLSADKNESGAERFVPDVTELNDIKHNLKKVEEHVSKLQAYQRQSLGRTAGSVALPGEGGPGGEETASMERRLARMEHQHTLTDVQMAEHDVKLGMLESTSYDGGYLWKIDDLTRRIHEAASGKSLSIYSPPFYVGRFGYKVCSRVYLNGDGMGKSTHISLFFVVMRSNYDALLPWPFQQKVTFKLIDQTGDHHIIDSFRPDPNSSSFQRPTSNMNIASGCPLFVPKSVLATRGYTKDDALFFKITVDSADGHRVVSASAHVYCAHRVNFGICHRLSGNASYYVMMDLKCCADGDTAPMMATPSDVRFMPGKYCKVWYHILICLDPADWKWIFVLRDTGPTLY